METSSLPIIGRYVTVSFPEWGDVSFKAKVDTGAYRCAIHAEQIQEDTQRHVLTFVIPLSWDEKEYQRISCQATEYKQRRVRNTSGVLETRYCVTTKIEILGKIYDADCTLANRSQMRRALLLGATFLKGKFLIDLRVKMG
jgi:hypothetical protein